MVLLAIVVAGLWETRSFRVLFPTDRLGPRAFPLAGGVLMLLGVGALLRARSRIELQAVRPWAIATLVLLLYAAALPFVGFFLGTTGAFAGLALLFGGPRVGSWLFGVGFSALLWVLFVVLLGLPLPIGSLWILGPG